MSQLFSEAYDFYSKIYRCIINDENFTDMIDVDRSCEVNMGKGDVISPICCDNCIKTAKLLGEFTYDKGNDKYKVRKYGRVNRVYSEDKNISQFMMAKFIKDCKNYSSCEHALDTSLRFIESDFLSNDIIVHSILFKKLPDYVSDMMSLVFKHFVCNEDMFTIEQNFLNVSRVKLNSDMVIGIVNQLILLYYELAKFDFVNTNNCIRSINLAPKKFEHDSIKSNVTIKLSNIIDCSLSYDGKRFYAKTILGDLYKSNESEEISSFKVFEDGVTYYKYNNPEYFYHLRCCGIPLYTNSFDFYITMLSLMNDKKFYEIFIKEEYLMNIWKMMWKVEPEIKFVEMRPLELIKCLVDIPLKCNLLNTLYDMIQDNV